jgi:hypothetical protein
LAIICFGSDHRDDPSVSSLSWVSLRALAMDVGMNYSCKEGQVTKSWKRGGMAIGAGKA